MNCDRRMALRAAGAMAAGCMLGREAIGADAWPSRPIRMVVPFAVGAGPDVYARLYASELSKTLKVGVWVDNKPGASGILGTDAVAKASPDGTTLLYGFNQLVVFNPNLFSRLPFDVNADLAPVSQLLSGAYVLVAHPSFGPSTLPQLVEEARRSKGKVNYASYGPGTASHLGMALIEDRANVELFHVPYKQGALADVIAGQVPLVMEPSQVAIPQIGAGKVKPIAVTSARRLSALPEVPTVAETLAGYDLAGWHAVFVPAKTESFIIERLAAELQRITHSPEMFLRLKADSLLPLGTTPAQLKELIAREQETWGKMIKTRNIRLD